MTRIVISSGHGKHVRGAVGYLDEVNEARRIVDRVASLMPRQVEAMFHDDVSTTQSENLRRIVDFHNSKTRDLDISVHFNAHQTTSKPMGCEVLYVSQAGLKHAQVVVAEICAASRLINRGAEKRTDLYFLNNTKKPAILIEVCFVDSKADADIYDAKFNEICQAIVVAVSKEWVPNEPSPTPMEDEAIMRIATRSQIADYNWKDRGVAPVGYVKGFALSWAQVVRKYLAGDAAVVSEMAKPDTHNPNTDALSWYADEFERLKMSNANPGLNTLRHLFVLLMGLGMRESSGKHCEGRDTSATNRSADTTEAGLFQTSYNAHSCSPAFDLIMRDYASGKYDGYLDVFAEGVRCDSSSWANYGDAGSRGFQFQLMCKRKPAFAVESAAIVLRNLRQHYGPINRREAELRRETDFMLTEVQKLVSKR